VLNIWIASHKKTFVVLLVGGDTWKTVGQPRSPSGVGRVPHPACCLATKGMPGAQYGARETRPPHRTEVKLLIRMRV